MHSTVWDKSKGYVIANSYCVTASLNNTISITKVHSPALHTTLSVTSLLPRVKLVPSDNQHSLVGVLEAAVVSKAVVGCSSDFWLGIPLS